MLEAQKKQSIAGSKLEARNLMTADEAPRELEAVPGVQDTARCDADREDRTHVLGDASGSVETPPEIPPTGIAEAGGSPEPAIEKEIVMAPEVEDKLATRPQCQPALNDEQLKYADEQNRPPHNRSHTEIGKELKVSQTTLSRWLKMYRKEHDLDEPAPVFSKKMPAKESAAGIVFTLTDARKLAEKLKSEKWNYDAIESKLRTRGLTPSQALEVVTTMREALKKRAQGGQVKRPTPKKLKHAPVDETAIKKEEPKKKYEMTKRQEYTAIPTGTQESIGAAEQARGELDLHVQACATCHDTVMLDERCLLGRAFSARWARLEILAAG